MIEWKLENGLVDVVNESCVGRVFSTRGREKVVYTFLVELDRVWSGIELIGSAMGTNL
ncbi:hypothetical protein DPMN_079896 [Dreissena polymorpha]|uniref:Uncharacterized protein n=1 Tax=Dreissena polymorpha TaxID=45954 RepID=A0A9D4BIR4_DREPO|nr:hypothetical protein DPMN_079896 [Dreissena polymorpha]